MKSKWYILIILMLIITAFTYKGKDILNNPSIKVTKVKLETNNVLCLQINIASINYIDSLIVEQSNQSENSNKKVFVFKPNTRRASVNFYFYGDENNKLKISLKTSNNNTFTKFNKILNIKDI